MPGPLLLVYFMARSLVLDKSFKFSGSVSVILNRFSSTTMCKEIITSNFYVGIEGRRPISGLLVLLIRTRTWLHCSHEQLGRPKFPVMCKKVARRPHLLFVAALGAY